MDVEKFQDDVYSITELLSEHLSPELIPKLNFVRQNLIEYYKKNLVKINHSVLELICAAELISHGFSVDVEKSISDVLVCDLFGKKGDGTSIIEIETGFTPPEHALDTVDYYAARIVSKIARYSKHCGKFSRARKSRLGAYPSLSNSRWCSSASLPSSCKAGFQLRKAWCYSARI